MGNTLSQNNKPLKLALLTTSSSEFPSDFPGLIEDNLQARETFSVLRIPLSEVASFCESLGQCGPIQLSQSHLFDLAQQVLSLFNFSYTPTASSKLPVRADVLINRILQQPPAFLPNFLKQVTEWFGFAPNRELRQAWLDITRNKRGGVELPRPLQDYQKHNLAAVVEDELLIPLVIPAASCTHSKLPDWDTLPNLLHKLRHILLHNRNAGLIHQAYQRITTFLRKPHPSLDDHIHRTTRARGSLVDLANYDWSLDTPQPIMDAVLVALYALYESDPSRYQALFNRIHGPVWHTVGQALKSLDRIESRSPGNPVIVDPTSYVDSSRLVSHRLKPTAEAYAILTKLETTLGVDRHLGGQALANDLSLVHDRVRQIGRDTHQSLRSAQEIYLRQWNLTSIASVILHLLDLPGGRGSLTNHFPSDRQRVIFLLVDALGYTQFQWFLNTVGQHTASPLASNIFTWLQEQNTFNDSYCYVILDLMGGS